MGTKVPLMIQKLETHRHKGVDFVVITQNPMLIDQNARRLVGRHQHVRRLFGMSRAVIYDWDGCNADPTKTKSATVTYFGYPKSAYELYKSSELHTKPKQKIPAWLALPVLALIGGAAIAPTAFGVMQGAVTGKGIAQQGQPVPQAAATTAKPGPAGGATSTPSGSGEAVVAVAPALPASSSDAPAKERVFGGCIVSRSSPCRCFYADGVEIDDVQDRRECSVSRSAL